MSRYLPPFICHVWDALRRPRPLFHTLTTEPALSAALLWLVLIGVLSGVTGLFAALQGKTAYGQDWQIELPMARAIAQSICFCLTILFWATVLTWALGRMVRETLRFEALFAVLSLAAAPALLTTLTFPLRDVNWYCYHCWQALNMGVVCWISVLICLGVSACMEVGLSKAAQCSVPALLIILALGWKAHHAPPTAFQTACRWEQREGQYVRVYFPPGKNLLEVTALVRGLDKITEQECQELSIQPPDIKISVFFFADDDLQRRLAGNTEEPDDTAHTFWDCVTLSYDSWDKLHTQLAHEMCHVLLVQRLTDQVHGLLDEGLCEYVAHRVAPEAEAEGDKVMPTSPIPLRTLARPEVFFDWDQVHDLDESEWAHYRSAHSLVGYLVHHYTMTKFKALYTRYAHYAADKDPDNDEGKQLAHAIQDVYGLSLRQLETQWRAAESGGTAPE